MSINNVPIVRSIGEHGTPVAQGYMTIWKRLNTLIRAHGIFNLTWLVFRYILRKTIGFHWGSEILLERSLEEPIQEIIPRIKVSIEQATEDDLDKFKGIVDKNKYNHFQQRFKKGRICFVALDEHKVVAYAWLSLEDEYESVCQVEVKLGNRESYLFDFYVIPEYRNNRLYSTLLATGLTYVHSQACKKAIALVGDKNTYPLRTCASAGFRPKKVVNLFTIFGLRFQHWQEYTGSL